jgi:phage antirepressor YoqD-like protein
MILLKPGIKLNQQKQYKMKRRIKSSYRTRRELYSVKDISQEKLLPFTKNKLYEKLREWGYLNSYNHPSEEQIEKGFMRCNELPVPSKISAWATSHFPLFTEEGLNALLHDYETRFNNKSKTENDTI